MEVMLLDLKLYRVLLNSFLFYNFILFIRVDPVIMTRLETFSNMRRSVRVSMFQREPMRSIEDVLLAWGGPTLLSKHLHESMTDEEH